MTNNDPLANVLSAIMNAERKAKREIIVKDNSKVIKTILSLMQKEGYVGKFEEIADSKGDILKIYLLGHINDAGVIKPRFNVKVSDFEKFEKRFLPARDFGVIFISTNEGVMTHTDAKQKNKGGTLISFCY